MYLYRYINLLYKKVLIIIIIYLTLITIPLLFFYITPLKTNIKKNINKKYNIKIKYEDYLRMV